MPGKRKDTGMKRPGSLTEVPENILAAAAKVGFSKKQRSGSYILTKRGLIFEQINRRFRNKIEIMDIREAARKYDYVEDMLWSLIDRNKDSFTKAVSKNTEGGYFMRILPGARVKFPLQSCLLIDEDKTEQRVHNLIVAEKGSRADIITGCTVHREVRGGGHLGISEFFIREKARLQFTMLHNWAEEMKVRPRSIAQVEEGGTFISNYILMQPVKDVQMYPSARCVGKNSAANLNSLLYAKKKGLLDIGGEILLEGDGSRGEIISRSVVSDDAKVIARGRLIGSGRKVKGHLECRGLMLSESGKIHAIPELIGNRKDIELSHEAAVGKIAEKEISYLMSRGLSEDDARAMIIRGFMDVGIFGLPVDIERDMKELSERTLGGI